MKQLVVIGDPIKHSLTPTIYNAAFKALDLENKFQCKKLRVETNDLANFIGKIRCEKILGANVTIPHKIGIMPLLDELTVESESIKAVNVVHKKDRKVIGHNTDCTGLIGSLKENNVKIKGKKIIILGAGGAARAIAYALVSNDANELVILNRTVSKAEEITNLFKGKSRCRIKADRLEDIDSELEDANILVNCTSVGMKGNQEGKSLVSSDKLSPRLVVMDMVYHPLKTKLLKDAEKIGAKTIDGSRMLLHQGVAAFEFLVGIEAPVDAMETALSDVLK